MINLLIWREVVAEILFVFDVCLTAILIRYLWLAHRNYPRQWWRLRHVQGAAAMLTLIFGHVLIRGGGIAAFVSLRRGGAIFDFENAYPVAFVGTLIAVVGLCWAIRLFARYEWQERAWIISVVIAALFVALMQSF